ncbi:MAG: T9SS type A sorting domain-containing protein [Caldithrix sp.]|nr:T9SS type A sorting domain-containing protein [Caldithrix sp.]
MSIYNILGKQVAMLVSKRQPTGKHSVQWDASEFASGLYFYSLMTNKGFPKRRNLCY